MKRFDSEAILGRMVNVLQSKSNWNRLQADGATYQLLEAIAEPMAELGRYSEYLLQELKWDTSRNFSSAKHMARLVGKKLDRKHSAVGSIIVSHSDPTGVSRYAFLGIDNFSVDSESNYDNLELDSSRSETTYTHALVPWTSVSQYKVPIGAIFNTTSGVSFISAETKSIQTCTVSWDSVNTSFESLNSFRSKDGWNNYKYLTIPVVQGIQKELLIGTSDGTAGQSFLISSIDIEAADNYYTKQFCYIEVEDTEGNVTKWTEIQHLQLATSTETVFELEILDDLSGTAVKFGDGISGAIPASNSRITIHYLETLGTEGNVTELYSFQNEISGAELPSNSGYNNLSIGCQNMWPIIGGKDLETLSEFKANTETAYAKNYEILHTYSELLDAINSISPIPLIKVSTETFYEESQINSTKVLTSKIGITGLSTAMQPLNSSEANLFETVINTELNKKVLSNKYIGYVAPEIVEVNTALEVELKTALQDVTAFETDVSDHLIANFGKNNINPINSYKQADILREALQYSSNIDSIEATSLLTVKAAAENVSYGVLGSQADSYFLFKLTFPKLAQNVYGFEGFCDKSLADGNEVYCVINTSINGYNSTFIVKETTYSENSKYLFEQDTYFSSTTTTYLYENNITELSKYVIKPLLVEKHVFTRNELKDSSNLSFSTTEPFAITNDSKGIWFGVTRTASQPTYYVALSANVVAEYLGYSEEITTENSATVLPKIYNNLLSSIDSDSTKISISIEPADKTVNSLWNTVIYYDNIETIVQDSATVSS